LPGTAATNPEMFAKWLGSVFGIASELYREAFGPVFFIFGQLDIQPVSGDTIFNENDFTLVFADSFTASGIIFYEYVFQNDFWAFFSHFAKIVDDFSKQERREGLFC
jgi:hypothetical protein